MNPQRTRIVTTIVIGVLTPFVLADCKRPHETAQTLAAEVSELEAAKQVLQQGPIPFSWDAGAFISASAIQRLLDEAVGAEVETFPFAGIRLTLTAAKVNPAPGATYVSLEIQARSTKVTSLSATFKAQTLLLYKSALRLADGSTAAIFRFSMLEVAPSVALGIIHEAPNQLERDVLSDQLINAFADQLTLKLPLSGSLDVSLANVTINRNDTGGGKGSYLLTTTILPGAKLSLKYILDVPLATEHGIWLLGKFSENNAQSEPLETDLQLDALKAKVAALHDEVKRLEQTVPEPDNDLSLWVRNTVFRDIVDQFNKLPPSNRVVAASVSDIKGLLDEQNTKVAGRDLGYEVELKGGSAAASIGPLNGVWSAQTGLQLQAPAQATASADVKVSINTVIGGGFSASPHLSGSANHV